MDDWIRSIVNTIVGPLRPLVDAVTKRVSSIWSVLTSFLTNVRHQWSNLRGRISTWVDQQIRHAQSVATTLKWIVLTYIPRKLGQLAASVKAWTADLIAKAEAKAKSLFDGLMKWAADRLASLLGLLGALRTWAIAQVNGLLDSVSQLFKRVFGTLGTPERLAAWAIDAIVSAAIKWGESNLHKIEALIASKRTLIWKMVISVIEDVLHDIL